MDTTPSASGSGQHARTFRAPWTGRDVATHWLLFALAIVAGTQTGGMLFDTLVNDPVWSESVEAARAWDIDTGRFYIASSNGMVVLAIITLVVGWRTPPPVRWWLRGATALFIIAVATTMAYFLPELQEIRGASAESIPDDDLRDRTLREVLVVAGFIMTIRAVGLSHVEQARDEASRS